MDRSSFVNALIAELSALPDVEEPAAARGGGDAAASGSLLRATPAAGSARGASDGSNARAPAAAAAPPAPPAVPDLRLDMRQRVEDRAQAQDELAQDAFEALGFDFPLVSTAELRALDAALRRVVVPAAEGAASTTTTASAGASAPGSSGAAAAAGAGSYVRAPVPSTAPSGAASLPSWFSLTSKFVAGVVATATKAASDAATKPRGVGDAAEAVITNDPVPAPDAGNASDTGDDKVANEDEPVSLLVSASAEAQDPIAHASAAASLAATVFVSLPLWLHSLDQPDLARVVALIEPNADDGASYDARSGGGDGDGDREAAALHRLGADAAPADADAGDDLRSSGAAPASDVMAPEEDPDDFVYEDGNAATGTSTTESYALSRFGLAPPLPAASSSGSAWTGEELSHVDMVHRLQHLHAQATHRVLARLEPTAWASRRVGGALAQSALDRLVHWYSSDGTLAVSPETAAEFGCVRCLQHRDSSSSSSSGDGAGGDDEGDVGGVGVGREGAAGVYATLVSGWIDSLHLVRDQMLASPAHVPSLLPVLTAFLRRRTGAGASLSVARVGGTSRAGLMDGAVTAIRRHAQRTSSASTAAAGSSEANAERNETVNRIVLGALAALASSSEVARHGDARRAVWHAVYTMLSDVVSRLRDAAGRLSAAVHGGPSDVSAACSDASTLSVLAHFVVEHADPATSVAAAVTRSEIVDAVCDVWASAHRVVASVTATGPAAVIPAMVGPVLEAARDAAFECFARDEWMLLRLARHTGVACVVPEMVAGTAGVGAKLGDHVAWCVAFARALCGASTDGAGGGSDEGDGGDGPLLSVFGAGARAAPARAPAATAATVRRQRDTAVSTDAKPLLDSAAAALAGLGSGLLALCKTLGVSPGGGGGSREGAEALTIAKQLAGALRLLTRARARFTRWEGAAVLMPALRKTEAHMQQSLTLSRAAMDRGAEVDASGGAAAASGAGADGSGSSGGGGGGDARDARAVEAEDHDERSVAASVWHVLNAARRDAKQLHAITAGGGKGD